MRMRGLTNDANHTIFSAMARVLALGLAAAGGGCVNVTAPDKPIEINLNISVTQEVVYRLDSSAKELIKDNPDIF